MLWSFKLNNVTSTVFCQGCHVSNSFAKKLLQKNTVETQSMKVWEGVWRKRRGLVQCARVMLPSWLWELRSNIWRHVVTACRKIKQSEIKPSRTENSRIWFKYILYVDLPNTLQEIKNLCFMNWLQSLAWTGGVKVRLRLWRSRDKWGWNNSETGNGIMGERKEEIAVHDEAEQCHYAL